MMSHSKDPSLEGFKNISKMINQDDQMTVQKKQKEFDKVVANKEEEISRLKNHNQSLVAQIKKMKNEKRSYKEKLEQLTSEEAMIDKETMTEPVEIEKLLVKKIQISEK
jgi:predicted RNase H-like nuclease (RuvC/YqgF family)